MGTSMGIRAAVLSVFCPDFRGFCTTWWLQTQSVPEDADDVRAVLVDPGAIVLADHICAGVAHLLGDPVN